MRTTRRETIGLATSVLLFALAILSGCSSAPGDDTASSGNKGNEVNRSDPEATAVAFADLYAAGNVPGACQLANSDGRANIGSKCERAQAWKTSVALVSSCNSTTYTEDDRRVPAVGYHFEAATQGSLDRNGDLLVYLTAAEDVWSVSAAIVPSSDDAGLGCTSQTGSSAATAGTR